MKIGLVLDDTLDSTDGVQQYVLLLGSWLSDQGHEVHYLVGDTTRKDIRNIHSLSRNKKVSFNKNKMSVPLSVNAAAISNLINDTWDVLHVQVPYSPLLAGKIIKKASSKTAVIGTFHIAPYSKVVSVANKLLGIFTKKALKRFDKIVAVSPVAKQFARQAFGLEAAVVPNAIQSKNWRSKSKKDIDVLFVGRLVERKGCRLLLEALALLDGDKKMNGKKVVIAGDGPLRESLEGYAKQANLDEIVTFAGRVSEDVKKDLLSRAKISIFPSTGGESFGIVLLEAMASGSLTIAGDNPGYRSVIGDAEDSLVETTPLAIADKIYGFLSDDSLYKRTLAKQKTLVLKFDISTVGNDILSIYEKMRKARKGNS